MRDEGLPRLIESGSDAPEALREALAYAREDLPAREQLEALAARLPLGPGPGPDGGPDGGGGGPDGGGAAGPGGPDPGIGIAAGSAAGLSGAAALKAGAVLLAAAVGSVAIWSLTVAPRGEPPARTIVSLPAFEEGADPEEPPAAAPSAAPAPPAEAAPAPSPTPEPAEPRGERPHRTEGVVERGPSQETPTAPAAPDPAAELGLLREAQDALSATPGRALSLVGRHAELFPASALSQEREVLAIDALVRLGRREAARARADRFRRRWPSSSHLPRLDRLTGGAE